MTSAPDMSATAELPLQAIMNASDKWVKPQGLEFGYGTAGFRTKGATLHSTLFRVGLLATLRSKKLDGKAVGVMITASHNPEEDNGAKLVDPTGSMLDQSWEPHATALASCSTTSTLLTALTTLISTLSIDLSKPSHVIFGRDTRPTGEGLVAALKDGLACLGGVELGPEGWGGRMAEEGGREVWEDRGVVTTPVLHYIVRGTNMRGKEKEDFGEASLEGYIQCLSKSFNDLMAGKTTLPPLYIDCANGVGASSISLIQSLLAPSLTLHPVCTSTTTPGALNKDCGADYVKVGQRAPPAVLAAVADDEAGGKAAAGIVRACSIDGDADRVVYYYLKYPEGGGEGRFRLLDGDKIATLAAGWIGDLLEKAGLGGKAKLEGEGEEEEAEEESVEESKDGEEGSGIQRAGRKEQVKRVEIGVVQTAYANGSSTRWLKNAGLPVKCVPTGVKHLHHAAERFDIGVYFEANGHGTVIFSPETLALFSTHQPRSPSQSGALATLRSLTTLINQAIGDALSDLLLVEVILAHRKWGPEEWDAAYEDLPNRLLKVNVPDRGAFKTEDAERRLVEPNGCQKAIDDKVRLVEMGRAFVRPSGTEDCVRVYAEAGTRAAADELAMQISQVVTDFASAGHPAA